MNKEQINNLNPKYTFETFVVGNSNIFAYQAALAVAETPGESYNPLFIYGKNGTGKTHLMHAIGNEILKNNKKAKVLYITSESFTYQLANVIEDNKIKQFRNKYKNVDILLIDNIQFLARKEKSQEELLYIFSILHENRKQIVICSDVEPKYISDISENIKKYEWGLIADIDVPEYETRLEILKKKAEIKTHR